MWSPPAYYINLERCPERDLHMIELFSEHSIRYSKVKGFDGQSLTDKEFRKIKSRYGRMSKAEFGCTYSHFMAIKAYLEDKENSDDYAMICEDDLTFTFMKYWETDLKGYIKILCPAFM